MTQEAVVGTVKCSVRVRCPHCLGILELNDYPYDVEEQEYSRDGADKLPAVLHGEEGKPAKWDNLSIAFQCVHCDTEFTLTELKPR